MVELLNWDKVIVPQRHRTGCIPTGYEWIIRYLGIQGVNLETFQEDFDLGNENNFGSVADRIKARYPQITIHTRRFNTGLEKIQAIRMRLEHQSPCLLSLALGGMLGWHVMPVVRVDNWRILMIHDANERGNHTWGFSIREIVWRHNNLQGGKDIARVETPRVDGQNRGEIPLS